MIGLLNAKENKRYIIKKVNVGDDETRSFLFRLGCYEGEPITIGQPKQKEKYNITESGTQALFCYT